jgi:hypothetical protein
MIHSTDDHRNLEVGQLVVLTYDYDYDTREHTTIGVITGLAKDAFGADTYEIYWFQRATLGEHYWFHIKPVTLMEFEEGLYYDYYEGRHSER